MRGNQAIAQRNFLPGLNRLHGNRSGELDQLATHFRVERTPPIQLPSALESSFLKLSTRIKDKVNLFEEVQDAMDRATSDPARRRVRHRFIMHHLKLEKRGSLDHGDAHAAVVRWGRLVLELRTYSSAMLCAG